MTSFGGFPDGPVRMTPVPDPFFSELLPQIDELNELKVSLYALWTLSRQERQPRCLSLKAMLGDPDLRRTFGGEPGATDQAVTNALDRAVARGTLLLTRTKDDAWFFLNSPRGRAAAAGLARGEWTPGAEASSEMPPTDRPNLFTLYEQNIGPLTPIIADLLREAEQAYSPEWVEEAIRAAVEHNARSWKYVQAVLEGWKKDGRRQTASGSGEDRRKYIEGEYADFIEH